MVNRHIAVDDDPPAAVVVVVEQAHLRFGVGETGTEGRTVGRYEILELMSEKVGRGEGLDGWIRWWLFIAVRHQVDLRRRSTSLILSEPFWDLSMECLVVDSWSVMHDELGCLFPNSVFSTDGVYCAPYFVQPVLEFLVVATTQTIHRRLLFPLQL